MSENPAAVAKRIRHLLRISIEEQTSWRRSDVALKAWKAAVERRGVLVFEASRIALAEMRGLSIHAERVRGSS
jgi:hypothetical protein